jgi:DUF1680 family protein
MNRRQMIAGAAGLPLIARSALLHADLPAKPPVTNAPAATPAVAGRPYHDRYQLCLHRTLHGSNPAYTSDFLLADLSGTPGRRFTNFSGDLSGRWIGALSIASLTYNEQFPVLAEVVEKALPLQKPEGYFGASFNLEHLGDDDMALLWGNGRLLVGLMEYYALRPDPKVLAAARRLGDFLVRIGPDFNSAKMSDAFNAEHFATSYICWTQQTEGLAALYAVTKEQKYRDLCAEIGNYTVRRPGDHVHGYLCSVRGLLDLHFATGDQALLDHAVAAWKDISQSGDLLITGGVPERWSPLKKRTEGCAECDWLRLGFGLYRATGDEVYLEAAEDLLFNDFSMNEFSSGDFGAAVLDDYSAPRTIQVRAWWCCTMHGLRAFSDIQRNAFHARDAEVSFNLPVDAAIKNDAVWLESQSFLATDGKIAIKVHRASASQSLNVRKPSWAESVVVSRNGRRLDGLRIDNLRAGDEVEVKYGMKLRVTNADRVLSTPPPSAPVLSASGRSALHYGPWLLGANTAVQPDYFNELHADNVMLIESAHPARPAHGRFAVPIAATTLSFMPAEYPEQKGRVELRAVAEQTMFEPATWSTSFRLRST